MSLPWPSTWTSGADGSWSIPGVPAGSYNLQFAKLGYASSAYFPTSMTIEGAATPGRLVATFSSAGVTGTFTPGT